MHAMPYTTDENLAWCSRAIYRLKASAVKTVNDICGEDGCILSGQELQDAHMAGDIIKDMITSQAMLAMHFGHVAKEAMPTMLPIEHKVHHSKNGYKAVHDPIPHSADDVLHGK